MNQKKIDTRKPPKAVAPAQRKRFRLEKLEERIAPSLHQNPQTKWVGGGNGGGGGGNISLSGGSIY